MEQSSPLAAMRPCALPFGQWGCRTDVPSYPNHLGGKFGEPAIFGSKDFAMPSESYFNLKPVRGSSPTTTLAADLSQNFHIDQRSPPLATPRRSLFPQGLFNIRECVTTPPIPSSPSYGNEYMDISPLPHKAPFAATQLQFTALKPEVTLNDEVISSAPKHEQGGLSEGSWRPLERRRPIFKSSLSRTRVHSTSVLTKNSRAENLRPPLPPFSFNNESSLPSPSLMSAEECFASSPPQQKNPFTANPQTQGALGPPKLKHSFSGAAGQLRGAGSPITGHVRKPSMPNQRPRKQFRRSLSMFEHPEDVLNREKADLGTNGAIDSVMDLDDAPKLQLPHFLSDEESVPRITKETMVEVLGGKYGQCYDHSLIVDCRFEYEYKGGHIEGAINVNNKEDLAERLFVSNRTKKTLLVFHCEYSAHRAPIMAKFVRHRDRATNAHRYPSLSYPEMYILEGGYSAFFLQHRELCFPQNYVEMGAKEHANACERGLGRIKQQRGKLSRAQTFAFGQRDHHSTADSPTAPGRQCNSSSMMGMDISPRQLDSSTRRLSSRRVASY